MKNSTKIFVLVLFLAIMDFTFSCCPPVEGVKVRYSHCKITVSNIDNSGDYPVVVTTGSIPKNNYGIKLDITKQEDSCTNLTSKYRFSIFTSAYACDQEDFAIFKALDTITQIQIISLHDFNSTHPANSDVSELFYVFEEGKSSTIEEFLNNKIYNFEGNQYDLFESILLLLNHTPDANTLQQFKVEIHLSDGRILSSTTPEIELI